MVFEKEGYKIADPRVSRVVAYYNQYADNFSSILDSELEGEWKKLSEEQKFKFKI